jgi:hypothetical protein
MSSDSDFILEIPEDAYDTFVPYLKTIDKICKLSPSPLKTLLTDQFKRVIMFETFRNELTIIHNQMKGDCLKYFHKLPAYPQREYELSNVIAMMNHLNQRRKFDDYNTVVYLNLCDDSKFYVGLSNKAYLSDDSPKTAEASMLSRLKTHRTHESWDTYWNTLYPVITNLAFFPGTRDEENLVTLLVSKAVGQSNVCGGNWTRQPCQFPDFDVQATINTLLNAKVDRGNFQSDSDEESGEETV